MRVMVGVFTAIFLSFLMACSSGPVDAVDSHGNKIQLSKYVGKWVVINYWATWSTPCLTEMQVLQQLSDQHKDKVVVIGVNFDGFPDQALNAFAKDNNIHFPLTSKLTSSKYAGDLITVVPTSLVLDPKGNLVKTLRGPQDLKTFIESTYLNE